MLIDVRRFGGAPLYVARCSFLHRGKRPNAIGELPFVRSVAPTDRMNLVSLSCVGAHDRRRKRDLLHRTGHIDRPQFPPA